MTTYSTTSPEEFRLLCRKGEFTGDTAGACAEYAQANLIVLPKKYANDFVSLCYRNSAPCPLLCRTPAGNPKKVNSTKFFKSTEVDLSTDFPSYCVYEKGILKETTTSISSIWSENHVGFLIGCSYSFENDLARNGLIPRHQTLNRGVPVYKTSKYLDPAGIFSKCTYVVSMRPYKKSELEKVRSITRKFEETHGEPVDWGYDGAERLGIRDLMHPDFGDRPEIHEDEIPVFWGCGVTPQLCVMQMGDAIEGTVMSHKTGSMLVMDITGDNIKNL